MINVAVISASSAVIVPDLSGKTAAEVLSALTAAELTVGTASTTTSGANGSNNGKVASQTIAAGTMVERYSSVGYSTYYYEAAPPPPPDPPTEVTCTPNGQGSYYAGQGVCSSGWAEGYNCSDGSTRVVCVSAPPPPPPPPCTPVSVPLGGGCYYVTNADCTTYYSPAGCGDPAPPPPPPTCTPSSTYMGGGCYAITNSDCSNSTSCG